MAWSLHIAGVSSDDTTTLDTLTLTLPARDAADNRIMALVNIYQDNSSIAPSAGRSVTVTLDPGGAQETPGSLLSDGVISASHVDSTSQLGRQDVYVFDITDVAGTPDIDIVFSAAPAGGTDWYMATLDILYGSSDITNPANVIDVFLGENNSGFASLDFTQAPTTGTNQFQYVFGGTVTGARNPSWLNVDAVERYDLTSPPSGGRVFAGNYESTSIETIDGASLGDGSTSGSRLVVAAIFENEAEGIPPTPPPVSLVAEPIDASLRRGVNITTNGDASDRVSAPEGRKVQFSVATVSAWTGTIELQIRFPSSEQDDWRTVISVTADTEQEFQTVVDAEFRVAATAAMTGEALGEIRVSKNRFNGP